MNDSRRSHEALSLRTFFDDQIHHLQALIDRLNRPAHEKQQQTAEDRQIVESFVDASNSKMRAVHGYSHKLRAQVRTLYNHVLGIADEIPAPIILTPAAFMKDPLVNALFACRQDIDKLFDTDSNVAAYLHAHNKYQIPVMYALLTANKREKPKLGIALLGDKIIRDVPQQAVNFSAHKIHAPCASSAELNSALKKYLFDRVITLARQEMASRMISPPFKTGVNSYASRVSSLANPEVYLNTLIDYIKSPAKLLVIEKNHFKLSKLGIKLGCNDSQCANEFDIHELTWPGTTKEVILQIAYVR